MGHAGADRCRGTGGRDVRAEVHGGGNLPARGAEEEFACGGGAAERGGNWKRRSAAEALMRSNTVIARNQTAADADLADPALLKLRDLVYRISGIFHAENKFYLLALRSRRRMKEIGSNSFADYFDQLTTRATRDVEMRSLRTKSRLGKHAFFAASRPLTP